MEGQEEQICERSYSPDSHSKRGVEYRCEADRSLGRYRERGIVQRSIDGALKSEIPRIVYN